MTGRSAGRATELPSVSVIACCYNQRDFVVQCLDSILDQVEAPAIQLIVTDDASADDSVEVIRGWIDGPGRVLAPELIAHSTNRGLCPTLNEALALARHDLVVVIATDDWMEPGRLAQQAALFLDPAVGVAYGDARYVDADGVPTGVVHFDHQLGLLGLDAPPHGDVFRQLCIGNFLPAPSAMVRRRALVEAGGWDESMAYEDYDMWLRLSRTWKFASHPEIVTNYRILDGSMNRSMGAARAETRVRAMEKHLRTGVRVAELRTGYGRTVRILAHAQDHRPGPSLVARAVLALALAPSLRTLHTLALSLKRVGGALVRRVRPSPAGHPEP